MSVQDNLGRAQYALYALNDPVGPNSTPASGTAKGNQLLVASKLQNTVGNALSDSSFESSSLWTVTSSAVTQSIDSGNAYLGSKSLKLVRATAGTAAGVYSTGVSVEAGATYTFSAYVKTGTGTAYIALHDGSNTATSETLPANSGWTRLEVSYTNTSSAAKNVGAYLLTTTAGTTYMDCAKVEKAPTASRYNLVENGDFRYTTHWSSSAGRENLNAAAPELQSTVYRLTGNPTGINQLTQTVKVSGGAGDSFVLSGWAKADSAPIHGNRKFALIATFKNGNTTVNTETVSFNPDAGSDIAWQYAASYIDAGGTYDSIVITVAYDYNVNTAWFDGIQLFKEEFGSRYTYDGNGNVTQLRDVEGEITTYTYTGNDLTSQKLPNNVTYTYTYDSYHNVKTATSAAGVVYTFTYDAYGNNTSVSIGSGSTKLTSSAAYTSDGNRLASTTDTAGKVTTYSYNANTNVLEWAQYPKDSTTTRTAYTYDSMYRLATASATVSTGGTLSAQYGYTNDNLTSLTTGSTAYSFAYNGFGLRTSAKIGSRNLASYGYTSRNNFLASLDYGNGDGVDYIYDAQGRVTKQTYEDGDTVTYRYDNSGTLGAVTDSATGITTSYHYDYADRLLRYVERVNNSIHAVGYTYDIYENVTALTETINGSVFKTTYGYDKDNRVTSVTSGNASEAYAYDAASRVSSKTTKNGSTTVLTDSFQYDGATPGRVSKLISAAPGYNVTYTYAYDDNGNILSVGNGSGTTSYVYDSANQLTRENNQAAGKTWVWTYDDAGNITSRKEYAYTTGTLGGVQSTVNYAYGDSAWGDLLTGYGGKTVTSDTIGNMLSDGTWTYTWEHGRELMTMSGGGTTWTNTYNADGLRTRRTNGSTTYDYIYNGSSLSQMTVGSNTLHFVYDASGTPMAVTYNGTVYYYATNLQGDVTAILNTGGTAVVQYTYDAWGKLLTTTGSMASTLGVHNPLRYRGYVYDTESGLYYLQSRYYDPKLGRFLNADAFASTGQGVLGNNMFAYCLNNPVNYVDSTGTLAYPGEIHNEVVRRIANMYGYNKEQFILYESGGFGRADLISADGQVWDVKRDKPRQIKAGKKQVQKYVENTWAQSPDTPLSVGGNEIEPGYFYHKSGLTTYKVAYRYAGDGVIAYDYRVSEFDYQTLATTVFVVGVATAAGIAAGLPSGAIAYLALT